jgi:hypothetical protein
VRWGRCAGLFDTQRAAQLAGLPRTNYGAVVKDLLSVNLSKDYTHYNWGLRPIGACVHSWRVRACVRACVRASGLLGWRIVADPRLVCHSTTDLEALRYALEDVIYLPQVGHILHARVQELGVAEELAAINRMLMAMPAHPRRY